MNAKAIWIRRGLGAGLSGLVLALQVLLGPAAAAAATAGGGPTLEMISVPLPESTAQVGQGADGSCAFSGDGLQYPGGTGEPSLPCQCVTVLLPPDADLATVRAAVSGCRFDPVPGEYDIAPVAPPVAGDGGPVAAGAPDGAGPAGGRDASVYGADALFPADMVVRVDVQEVRQWKTAQVLYAPFACNPVRRQLWRASGGAIEVTFGRRGFRTSSAAFDGTGSEAVRQTAVNWADMSGRYGGGDAPADAGGYVIITTSAVREQSVNLADFAASKEARGFTVRVVTEEEWGGGAGNAAAEHIRAWLKSNYVSLGIRYVLLIGDPCPATGDVPMKMCYPQTYAPEYEQCPTDFYYAELTSAWNADGDSRYGECGDDFFGNPPRAAEVAVGRIPYYGNVYDLDHILVKIMSYENAPSDTTAWRRKALLPMEPCDQMTPGYQLAEEIRNKVLVPGGWACHRVYDSDYGLRPAPETVPCTVDGVARAWNGSDFGAILWWTHGWSEGAADVMDLGRVGSLDDEHPGFTFQASCHNGQPEDARNLGYSLLRNGCIATVSASRVSWYSRGQESFAGTSTASGMAFEYSRRLIAEGMYAGDALNDLRLDTALGSNDAFWMNYLVFNLYGCPAVGVTTSGQARPPMTVRTSPASGITGSQAVLNGALVSQGPGSQCRVSFEWGATDNYGSSTPEQVMTGAGAFSQVVYGLQPGATYHFRACASSGAGESCGADVTFTTGTEPPSVESVRASDITVSSAVLEGRLISLGGAASARVCFEWGLSQGYGSRTPLMAATGAFTGKLIGLKANTTYHFRAVAEGDTTVYGRDIAFTTRPIVPPSVVTGAATDVSSEAGRLNAELTSLGTAEVVTACFVWGITPGGPYPNETTGYAMTRPGAFDFNLTGLTEGITYYFKPKVVAAGGAVYGPREGSFTTVAAPIVVTGHATAVTGASATLNGSLNALGTAVTVGVSFEWGTSTDYGRETRPQTMSAAGEFSAGVSGLATDTRYHFRAKVVGDSTAYGEDLTLMTSSEPAAVAPAVSTLEAGPVTADSARLNGELSSLGTAGLVTVSFVWGTAPGGPYPNEVTKALQPGAGAFHFDLGSLASGTVFYYQAKAAGDGTSFGGEKSFTTANPGPKAGPSISRLVAGRGRPGEQLTVTITGANLTGALSATFGAGITVDGPSVVSDSQMTLRITIAADAAAGGRDVTVITPAGAVTVPGGFTVDGEPGPGPGAPAHLWVYLAAGAGGLVVLGILAASLGLLLRRPPAR